MMKNYKTILVLTVAVLFAGVSGTTAQSINLWRGNETGADWNDVYKWKLKHLPSGTEAVHFRQQSSVISINSTIELGNGMHLYGQELLLEGNGNINLRSPIPHQSTITIPASNTGNSSLTLTDNLTVNAQISLAAKAFGTSASKGFVTLKKRSTIIGNVSIGNAGKGTGQIVLRDQSTYRITDLKLDTEASQGGSAEIHILGGTARFAVESDPFEIFLADPSRKIIIGDNGTLHIESDLPIAIKKQQLEKLIAQKQIVSTSGCELGTPVIRDHMISLKAEHIGAPPQAAATLAATAAAPMDPAPEPKNVPPPPQLADAPAPVSPEKLPTAPLSGFIVFLSALLLLAVRPVKTDIAADASQSSATGERNRNEIKTSNPSPKVIDINRAA